MGALENLLSLPDTGTSIITSIRKQKRFLEKKLLNDPDYLSIRQRLLSRQEVRRVTGYYALYVPALLGKSFTLLRGYPMSENERMTSTCQGAASALFDDFFDRSDLSGETIRMLIEEPDHAKGQDPRQELALKWYRMALEHAPDPGRLNKSLLDVFEAQVLSRKQKGQRLSFEELKEISLDKGGKSFLLYRTAFEHSLHDPERRALLRLGGLMQVANDIFDLYEDQQNGIQTLMTTSSSVSPVRHLFDELWQETLESAWQMNYKYGNILRFTRFLALAVISRSLVCLSQYNRAEKKTGQGFDPGKYPRSLLVCDMEKAGNLLKTTGHYLRLSCRMPGNAQMKGQSG